jgi:hypothetical protein
MWSVVMRAKILMKVVIIITITQIEQDEEMKCGEKSCWSWQSEKILKRV